MALRFEKAAASSWTFCRVRQLSCCHSVFNVMVDKFPIPQIGDAVTEGDQVLKADIARQLFGLDGSGIKIGIISTSFNALPGLIENAPGLREDVKSGDLPGEGNPNDYLQPVNILADVIGPQVPNIDEGRALAQIIHDIAPGAELFFHTAFEVSQDSNLIANEGTFANAVSALAAEGVDIIVEDIIGINDSLFQDGRATRAIEAAIDQGVVVVSEAGNNGNISYESEFRLGAEFEVDLSGLEGIRFQAHDFDPTDGVDVFQNIVFPENSAGRQIFPLLGWDDPIGDVTTQYVPFLVNTPELPNSDNIVGRFLPPDASSPSQALRYTIQPDDEELYLVIAKVADATPGRASFFKWVSRANGSDVAFDYEYIDEDANNRTVFEGSNAPSSISVGATDVNKPTDIREYSSRGGSPILFDAEGNRLANPILRDKPEIYAPDGVATTVPDFENFDGTSAAAPHIAGVVALMLERGGKTLTPEEVRFLLQATASPIPGEAGLAQADQAVLGSVVSSESGTDANDTLRGNDSAENLFGEGGNDLILGKDGKDYLVGGDGRDTLAGGSDNDVLYGNSGNDVLRGDNNRRGPGGSAGGDDFISGGAGDDRIGGKGGSDRLLGDAGDDHIWGDAGDDWIRGGTGDNTLVGDNFSSNSGSDTFVLTTGEGADLILDFELDADFIGLADELTREALTIVQGIGNTAKDTFISFGNDLLARLAGVNANDLAVSNFLKIDSSIFLG